LSYFKPSAAGKQGIDIGGHEDQPVNAAANGMVVYAGSGLVGYGRLIIVKHNESLLSAYGHNNKLLVNEGEHVSAGQMIAKMGSSGTNRNQLYFEIRKNGKPTDPMGYLPKQ
jgi:lipoprotein NlpD